MAPDEMASERNAPPPEAHPRDAANEHGAGGEHNDGEPNRGDHNHGDQNHGDHDHGDHNHGDHNQRSAAESATVSAETAASSGAEPPESPQREAPSEPAPAEGALSEPAPIEAAPTEAAPSDAPHSEQSAAEAGSSSSEGEATADHAQGDKPKKKRRRRRKRKPADGEAAKGEGSAEESAAEGHAEARHAEPSHGEARHGDGKHAEGKGGAGKHGSRRGKGKRPSHRPSERPPFQVGEEVFGKVTAALETAIMIDLSGKALAIFDRTEMEPDDLVPDVGDRFVARIHQDGSRGGLVVLTRKPLREEETKPLVEQAAKDGSLVSGLLTGVIKGGLEVDVGGLRAFAPASGMDLHPAQANFTALLGQRMEFKVLKYDHAGRDVVVTRRPMLEAEAHERRKHALTLLQEGQVMKGIVRTVVEWGAFVQLPEAAGLEGLVHISEASHDPRAAMSEQFSPGDEVEVKIIKIDERGKIWLSRKALIEDPWAEARQKYAAGTRHTGKVTRLEPFGVFVELESGVEGLIHVSDLSLQRIEHPKDILQEGQDVDVVVHHFDLRNKKLGLHPAPKPEHADEAPQKIARNATVQAEVIKGDTAGVVVRLLGVTGRAARGFIPAGQTGTARGTDLRKVFKPGSRLEAKIIDVDPKRGEPKLSIRSMREDEERRAHKEYRQKLKQEAHFGTLGDLLRQKLKAAGSGGSEE
jgi:small subunit ribosomal protein S1